MPNLLATWQLIFCGLAWLVEDVHGLRREDLCIFSGALSVRYAATLLTFAHIHGPLSRGAIGTLKGLDGHFEQLPLSGSRASRPRISSRQLSSKVIPTVRYRPPWRRRPPRAACVVNLG